MLPGRKHIAKLMVLTFLITSCAGSAEPTQEVNALMTSAIGTMVASYFGTQTAVYTPATRTPTKTNTSPPLRTISPYPSMTPLVAPTFVFHTPLPGSVTPTGTLSTATINPAALAVGCNNLAFIRDVTIPPGTVLQKNQEFTKTWKVQNTGTCNWLYQYSLVLVSGDSFGGKNFKIQKLVKINDWTELSLGMTTPDKTGTFTNYWRLFNGQKMFGATLIVSFVVADPPTLTSLPTSTDTPLPQPTDTSTLSPTLSPSDTPSPTSTP
jgi:hypothetical protein